MRSREYGINMGDEINIEAGFEHESIICPYFGRRHHTDLLRAHCDLTVMHGVPCADCPIDWECLRVKI